MKKNTYLKLSVLALTCVLASCSSQNRETIKIPVSATVGADRSVGGQIFKGVNYYRAQKGKSALKRHAGLDRLAQEHCEYLARTSNGNGMTINHHGFDGRSDQARYSLGIRSIGENVVASTTHSGTHLVNLWIASKHHEYNMRSKWTYTGIGTIVTPDGKLVSTQLFGTADQAASIAGRN